MTTWRAKGDQGGSVAVGFDFRFSLRSVARLCRTGELAGVGKVSSMVSGTCV